MSGTTPTQAVAAKAQHPAVLIQKQYAARLAAMVPTHVNGEAWVRQLAGLLRDEKLAEAASSDFDSFLNAAERAANLGLRPGTEEFYMRPIKIKGKLQVQGITGYQGLVDLMYRTGAVGSVVVETVRQSDIFSYVPGRMDRPIHEIDWDAEDRGPLRLVYAYAVMATGAVSKVVVLPKVKIEKEHRAKSDGYLNRDGTVNQYSPWFTNEESMWLKTGARQLAKWVPTSTEYIAQRAQAEAIGQRAAATQPVLHAPPVVPAIGAGRIADGPLDLPPGVDEATGEIAAGVDLDLGLEPSDEELAKYGGEPRA